MANKRLFNNSVKKSAFHIPPADTFNGAGGKAYSMSDRHSLAQYVATGCFNSTYYTSAETQLATVLELANKVDPEFLGKVAIYGHQNSLMRDVPAFLCAVLATRSPAVLNKVFSRVIDSGNMLRTYTQMLKGGAVGRKCLGTVSRKNIQRWFDSRTPASIFHQSIGNDPTLGDVIRLAHVKPDSPVKAALFAYLTGAKVADVDGHRVVRTPYLDRVTKEQKYLDHQFDALPELVCQFEAWKADNTQEMPKLNFRFLDGAGKLTQEQWKQIVRDANWLTTMKNLAAWGKRGIWEDKEMVKLTAARLRDESLIRRARVFPYQIMMAYLASDNPTANTGRYGRMTGVGGVGCVNVPTELKLALQDAMEIATRNVPKFSDEGVYVAVDVSGSMSSSSPTGNRGSATSKVTCIHVAGLIGATVLRTNPHAEIIPFEGSVVTKLSMNPRDSVMTNALSLASIGGGSTNCSSVVRMLNRKNAMGKLIIFASDNESWVDSGKSYDYPNFFNRGTELMAEWDIFHKRNAGSKLVCIDMTPRTNSQVTTRKDILQVGGFSDDVFNVIDSFVKPHDDNDYWVNLIEESVSLDEISVSEGVGDEVTELPETLAGA